MCDESEGLETTARQRQVLRYIRDSIRENGYAPSVRELCESLGVESTSAMIKHLEAIARKGLIVREPSTARALRVTELGEEALRRD
jgi:repressor LexA